MTNKGELIVDAVKEYIQPSNEELFFKCLINHLYNTQCDSDEAEPLILELYSGFRDLPCFTGNTGGISSENIINYFDQVYTMQIGSKKNSLNNLPSAIKKGIQHALNTSEKDEGGNLTYCLDDNTSFIINEDSRQIEHQKRTFTVKGKYIPADNSIVVNACPEELIIHDSPLDDEGRLFTVKWISHDGTNKPFFTKQYTVNEIEDYLTSSGYVVNPRLFKGCIACMIQALIDNKRAIIHSDIETPGFYHSEHEGLKIIDYSYSEPDRLDLMDAFTVLNQLVTYFKGNEAKLATGLKWGWMSAFSYMKKQIGRFQPYLYLYGKAGSGKTTLGQIILYLWNQPCEDNDIGGGSFDTPARIGKKLSESTFPLIVNEPRGMFNRPNCVEIIKSSVERTGARGRYEGRAFKTINALAPVIFTANQYIPEDDALLRRFEVIMFTHNERKSEEEKKSFEDTFMIGTKDCTLDALKNISYHILGQIMTDPSVLSGDWKKVIDKLLIHVYDAANISIPEWLTCWSETVTLQDMDDEETESIRMFLLDRINREVRNITVYDEYGNLKPQETFEDNVKTSNDFYDRVWHVLNERKIPWAFLWHNTRKNKDLVCFTTGMKHDLGKYLETCNNLKSIAEMLNWSYSAGPKTENRGRVMHVEFKDFIEFLYPTVDSSKMGVGMG